jgi:hypothetical protein
MRRALLGVLFVLMMPAAAQDGAASRELVGRVGSRSALLVLYATRRADGGWQLSGEYVVLATLARRFLEGERSPQLGVTTLKEGASPILFGRPATGTLRGTWRGGVFKGTRYGPGGQERERFEFNEEFPSMDGYGANVRCEVADGRYSATLAYTAENGAVRNFEWRSKVEPSGHACAVAGLEQQSLKGGLRLGEERCSVTLRDLGEQVMVAASCAPGCGSEAYLEAMLVDRRGNCRLLRPQPR